MLEARLLAWTAGAHVVLAAVLAVLAVTTSTPLAKPLKFAVSIALLLASLAAVVPRLQVAPVARAAIAWTLVVTMVIEMAAIVLQAARRTPSHFNTSTPFDTLVWNVMGAAIVVAFLSLVACALLASLRPLRGLAGADALAWRAGLWLVLLAAVSGFLMARLGRHSIGGVDGGAGLPVTGWSTAHGDLRVSHFIALHALQVLPITSWVLARASVDERVRRGVVVALAVGVVMFVVASFGQALAARPLIRL